jgi:hypothetical protein
MLSDRQTDCRLRVQSRPCRDDRFWCRTSAMRDRPRRMTQLGTRPSWATRSSRPPVQASRKIYRSIYGDTQRL